MTTIVAFTAEQACKLTGLSMHQLRYWDTTSFFKPRATGDRPGAPFGRIYSFRDIVGLRTISILRNEHHLPLQNLRSVGTYLRDRFETPWASLQLFVVGTGRKGRVIFKDPATGTLSEARGRAQTFFPIDLGPIASDMDRRAEQLKKRRREQIGVISRNRYVAHNEHVVAGTRIPTRAVRDLHDAGFTVEKILKEYPSLRRQDVTAALRFERSRRAA